MKKTVIVFLLTALMLMPLSACNQGGTSGAATAPPASAADTAAPPTAIPPAAEPTSTPKPAVAPPTENEVARGEADVNGDGTTEGYGIYQFNPLELPADIPTALGTVHLESVNALTAGQDAEVSWLLLPFTRGTPESITINPRPLAGSRDEDFLGERSSAKVYFYDPATQSGATYIARNDKIQAMFDNGALPSDLWQDSNWILFSLWFNDPANADIPASADLIFGETVTYGAWNAGHPIVQPAASLPGQGVLMSPAKGSFSGLLFLVLYFLGGIDTANYFADILFATPEGVPAYHVKIRPGQSLFGPTDGTLDEKTGDLKFTDFDAKEADVDGQRLGMNVWNFSGDPYPEMIVTSTQPIQPAEVETWEDMRLGPGGYAELLHYLSVLHPEWSPDDIKGTADHLLAEYELNSSTENNESADETQGFWQWLEAIENNTVELNTP